MHVEPSPSTGGGTRLRLGSEHPWPDATAADPDLALLEGEIAGIAIWHTAEGQILRRRTFCCLNAPCILGALPALPDDLEVHFKVVRAARDATKQNGTLQPPRDPPEQRVGLAEVLRLLTPPVAS